MTTGLEKLIELKSEAEKYEGCLTAWSRALGYKNYQAFFRLFEAKKISNKHLEALLEGAVTIKGYRDREQQAIKQVESILV